MGIEQRTCQSCKTGFAIEPEDFDFYKKISVPPPTWCPQCRLVRRMAFRNERSLYRRACDLCKKNIVAMYPKGTSFPVYCRECWYSDSWDPLEYGREYDFSRPFFEQLKDLFSKVPHMALYQYGTIELSEYANFSGNDKNAYLAVSAVNSENIFYSRSVDDSKDCMDCSDVKKSELAYEAMHSNRVFKCRYVLRSDDCINSSFLFDCANCQDCFMSSNLRNKRYVFRNEQRTKEEYEKLIGEAGMGGHSSVERLKQEFSQLVVRSLHRFANLIKVQNCTGDDIENSKNVSNSFDIYGADGVRYGVRMIRPTDVMDTYGSGESELMYEGIAVSFGSYNSKFLNVGNVTSNCAYTDYCMNCSYLLGCMSLRNKDHCILNRQYSEKEYSALSTRIFEHMDNMPYADAKGREYRFGEFFPPELSPFAYNETIAQEYFSLTREEVEGRGYAWKEPERKDYGITLKTADLPEDIKSVGDDITEQIIECAHGGKCSEQCATAFRVVPHELGFYRQMELSLPRLCPNCRHHQRLKKRNPLKLWRRRCMCDHKAYRNSSRHQHHLEGSCPNEFETAYAPGRPETVYCEQCYQAEVI